MPLPSRTADQICNPRNRFAPQLEARANFELGLPFAVSSLSGPVIAVMNS